MMATAGHKEEVPQRSIELAVTVLVTILNIVEIIVISTLNHQLKTFELLLLSLSASDLLFGLSNGILCVIYLTDHTKYELFEITYTTTFYFVLTSILTLSWIALDRLWAVCWPFSHSYYITRGRTRIIIIATWIFTTATGVSLFVYHELSESEDVKIDSNFTTAATTTATSTKSSTNTYKADIQLALSIFILLADVVFCFSYGYIIYNVKQTNQSITAVKDNVFQKVSTVCILIATVFITFTLPYAFFSFNNWKSTSLGKYGSYGKQCNEFCHILFSREVHEILQAN